MPINIRWSKSAFNDEVDEFKRVSQALKIPLPAMYKAYQAKRSPTTLYASQWQTLRNTDSYRIKDFATLVRLLNEYRRPMESLGYLMDCLLIRRACELPIVLAYVDPDGDQRLTLVSGNTRLCLCKLFKIQPKILVLDMISYGDDQ